MNIHFNRQKGVTLLELMIVLAIVAVLLSAGVPSLQSFTVNRQADRLAAELQQDLSYARNMAVTQAAEVRVTPQNTWSTGWVIRQNWDVIRQKGSIANPMAPAGVVTSTFTAAAPLVFDRQGRVIRDPGNPASLVGSFTIDVPDCTGNRERNININFIGQIVTVESLCQ